MVTFLSVAPPRQYFYRYDYIDKNIPLLNTAILSIKQILAAKVWYRDYILGFYCVGRVPASIQIGRALFNSSVIMVQIALETIRDIKTMNVVAKRWQKI